MKDMHASPYHIAKSIETSSPLSGVTLITSAMPGNPVVSIAGSFRGGACTAKNPMVPEIMAALLTEGTKKRSKKKIEESLDAIGAEVMIDATDERIIFSARCLKKDVRFVLALIAEELTLPLFSKDAFEKVKKRTAGSLHQAEDSTRGRAMNAFLHALYPADHPHHVPTFTERLLLLKKTTLKDVVAHHKKIAARGSLIVTASGDTDHKLFAKEIKLGFSKWPETAAPQLPPEIIKGKRQKPIVVRMPGKPNMDAVIGSPLSLVKTNAEYIALSAALGILGGREGFNGRLMQIVREKMGLTYGIYAFLSGFDEGRAGYWYVWGTFSPKDLVKGLDATKKEILRLVDSGITDDELTVRKNIVRGSYAITLSTTGARTLALLKNAEDGRSPAYLDEYPALVGALTRKEVNDAIKTYLNLNILLSVAAGGK